MKKFTYNHIEFEHYTTFKENTSFSEITRNLTRKLTDSNEYDEKFNAKYSHSKFYAAAGVCQTDVFKCKFGFVVPCENHLAVILDIDIMPLNLVSDNELNF